VHQEEAGEKTNIARTRGNIEKKPEKFMTSEGVTLLHSPIDGGRGPPLHG
jgi:hypothetical protein